MIRNLKCPHCGRESLGQIQYFGEPGVEYLENGMIRIETVGECFDCGEKVEVIEYATIDEVEVEKY